MHYRTLQIHQLETLLSLLSQLQFQIRLPFFEADVETLLNVVNELKVRHDQRSLSDREPLLSLLSKENTWNRSLVLMPKQEASSTYQRYGTWQQQHFPIFLIHQDQIFQQFK
jgi:hypothetical protein